ncbi:hypothetical protein OUZ56_002826 [Daphnia magna]|uniref:Uncharacterized protein n=1 Tax=Daphnia magna TaxID=35525 RepID=A0ABR0A6W9_9CRUS|nr:hypothetical protein OUZ56_002826 [Daphnia magna]
MCALAERDIADRDFTSTQRISVVQANRLGFSTFLIPIRTREHPAAADSNRRPADVAVGLRPVIITRCS